MRTTPLAEHGEMRAEMQQLRKRPATLFSVSLRISESVDLDSVLRSAVERSGARSSAIATIDETGR